MRIQLWPYNPYSTTVLTELSYLFNENSLLKFEVKVLYSHPSPQILCLIVRMHELCGLCGGWNFASMICISVYVSVSTSLFFQTAENQNLLCRQEAVPALAALLCSPHYTVQMPSLRCLANMCFQNQKVSAIVATSRCKFFLQPSYISRTVMHVRCFESVHKLGMPVAADD
jgi:hypothetical protein